MKKGGKEVEDGCGGCKFEADVYWKYVKRLRFCVSLPADFHHKLHIPKKFAENMRPNILQPKMNVKGPSGASWEVALMRNVDGLFLQEGWEEFANAYSLKEKDILFFKYDRNSSFDVKIFDGQCEKESAYFVKKCAHSDPTAVKDKNKRVLNEIVDEDDCNDDDVRVNPKKPRKDAETNGLRPCVRTSKKISPRLNPIQMAMQFLKKKAASKSSMEVQGRDSHAGPELAKQPNQNGSTSKSVPSVDGRNPPLFTKDSHAGRDSGIASRPDQNGSTNNAVISVNHYPRVRGRKRSIRSSPSKGEEYVSNRRPVTDEEKNEALRKAAFGLCENSFFSAMRYTCCCKGFFMTIPCKFANKHLGYKNHDVILRIGEKKWRAKFSFSRSGLGAGWKKFALDNNLEEWDVCLFKLVNQENSEAVILDVTIFRVVEEITPPTLVTT